MADDYLSAAAIGALQGFERGLMPFLKAKAERKTNRDDLLLKQQIFKENLPLETAAKIEIQKAKPPVSINQGRSIDTRGALESGYASIDFLKEFYPDLQEGIDVSVGELKQKAALFKSQQIQNNPKQVPSEQIDKITNMRTAIDGLSDIRGQYFSLIAKGKNPVDPVKGRWSDLKKQIGVLDDKEVARFQTDLVGQMNSYLNAISGAAITPQEAERLKNRIPKTYTTKEQFLGEWDSFDSELRRSLGNRIKTLRDANYKIGDLNQFILSDQKRGKNETTTGNELKEPKFDNGGGETADDILRKYGILK